MDPSPNTDKIHDKTSANEAIYFLLKISHLMQGLRPRAIYSQDGVISISVFIFPHLTVPSRRFIRLPKRKEKSHDPKHNPRYVEKKHVYIGLVVTFVIIGCFCLPPTPNHYNH